MAKSKLWLVGTGVCIFLASCSSNQSPSKTAVAPPEQQLQFDRFLRDLNNNLNHIWGVEEIMFNPTDIVKYSDNWNTRAAIHLASGFIRFETVNENYYNALKTEIIYTLLMDTNPEYGVLYDTSVPFSGGRPFLSNQVVDNNGKPVLTMAQANAFATYLLNNKISIRTLKNGKFAYYIDLPMIKNHLQVRAKEYSDLVYKYSSQYGVDPKLMFAIMEVESAFNPYAVSSSRAIGLMQIVPRTAGLEVSRFQGVDRQPTEKFLFNPDNNVHYGAAYIYIMQTRYFQNVKNPLSRRYLLIGSYNGGPGGMLSVFSKDRSRAIDVINRMTPQQVYNVIAKNHYSAETRRYIWKVTQAYNKY
ncbi:murein transglycosylase domain-containing protein [Psittacicella melopsittaci]|uniref:murein transglycosylase domain-containing protein n=1 Tax=Psittacicella melopsittaci TaxID=2028576 RepID=UPI001CA7A465|nr:murein transglycosylase domain-containing protein [Psittacicella melopsittaci]